MTKELKTLLGGLVLTLLLVVGFALWRGEKSVGGDNVSSEVFGLEVNPENYDLGNVPINGGIVTKEYEIKNTTNKALKLKKITTSCMCTTASVRVGDKETKFFGMEMAGDRNAPVNIEIAAGEIAKVTVKFDPAAHGPQGIGPFDRIVWLTFADPGGIKELKFNGTVVDN